jgi:type IV pilus biogenesis protein CpaD/CtpE
MTRRSTAACAILLLGASPILASCAATEPYQRPEAWSVTGASAANLAAMVDDPADLARGRPATGTDAVTAAAAVDRLWKGHLKALPDSSSSSSSSTGTGASQSN